jgi:hypothetical protein
LEFGGVMVSGYEVGEMAQGGQGGDHGLQGPADPAAHQSGDLIEVEGELIRVVDKAGGDLVERGGREGAGVAAVLEVVEVVQGGAGAAGTKFGVAVGAATGVVPLG